jgi:hypothetical protein
MSTFSQTLQACTQDEDVKKKSETQIEVLTRTLSDALENAGGVMPLGLHLQQDNCVREGKNQWMMGLQLI